MNTTFTIAEDILKGKLRPWMNTETHDEHFASIITDVKTVQPTFQYLYEFDFQRPTSSKTQYYKKLIENETIQFTNCLIGELQREDELKIRKYQYNHKFAKHMQNLLSDIGKLIKSKQYSLDYINPKSQSLDIDIAHKECTFIIQLLKTAIIKAFLEVQEFVDFIEKDSKLIADDLFLRFIKEPIPDNLFLKESSPIVVIEPMESTTSAKVKETVGFQTFTYIDYAKNSDKLTDLCNSLKKGKFIDQNTSLSDFKNIFSGKPVSTPILWNATPSDFYYFIKLIYTDYKCVIDLKQKQWVVAFSNSNYGN